MSAIAGIYFADTRTVDTADIQRMIDKLVTRGPHGSGVWAKGSVGLGHQMLWTTPESLNEKLPFEDSVCDLAITADARIDNRPELIANLGLSPARDISDSALILSAYEKWGESCPERLLGDFVFAIWDARRRILFCARDRFGVKPFYYYHSEHRFFFASEIKGLLALSVVPRRLNEARVADYLSQNLTDTSATFYQDIFRLPPAQTLVVDRNGVKFRTYWTLDPSRERRLTSNEEYAEAFLELFSNAVHNRLRSAFPVGSLLSGGLDSSSIVCTARKLLEAEQQNKRLHTFSAVFDEIAESDERPFISSVLDQGDLIPHYVHGDQVGPLSDYPRVFEREDEPFYSSNLFLHWHLYAAAQRSGVRVLLDGVDGDTTVSHGAEYLTDLARSGRWMRLAAEISGLSRRFNSSPWRILFVYAVHPFIPDPIIGTVRTARRMSSRAQPDAHIRTDFAKRIDLAGRLQLKADQERSLRTLRSHDHHRFVNGIAPFALEIADRAAATFSVEPRYPFFDARLVEFCLALPPEQKLHQGWTRVIMRRAMAGVLPEKIRWRGGKGDLSHPFTRGLLSFHRELVEDVIFAGKERLHDFVNFDVLREAYHRYASGGATARADAHTVWKAISLGLWLREASLAE